MAGGSLWRVEMVVFIGALSVLMDWLIYLCILWHRTLPLSVAQARLYNYSASALPLLGLWPHDVLGCQLLLSLKKWLKLLFLYLCSVYVCVLYVFSVYVFSCICVFTCAHTWLVCVRCCALAGVRGLRVEAGSRLPLCGFWRLTSGHQVWQAAKPLPTEPSCWPVAVNFQLNNAFMFAW